MGQDGEAAAELVATIRGEHVVMKTWFMGDSADAASLRKKYGPYPGLWKEVLNWPGWKEARKMYLQHQQKGESPAASSASTAIPRKRRSRWGTAEDSSNSNGAGTSNGGTEPPAKQRRSRWATASGGAAPPPTATHRPPPVAPMMAPLPGLPGMPTNLPPHEQEKMKALQARLRVINEKLQNLETEAARVDNLPRGHRERSPSPPPVYGVDGKRKNTRAVRWRERYSAERQDVLEEIMGMNPATRKSGLFKRKRSKKVRIPVEQHPTYNFIGLIIGPRGKTQKELEAKTGCKIAIRGRGSVKEGARGRRDGKMMEGDNEPLHVVITGDDQKSVDAATDMIEQMLVVIDDERNVHKQNQLRELALLNGTLKEDEFCQICAEKGHRSFECPKRFSMNKNSVSVKCAICGDTSHPTRDCTQKKAATDQANPQELDSDYAAFMNELDGKKAEKKPPAANNAAPKPPDVKPPGGALPPPPGAAAAAGLPPPPPGTGAPHGGLPPTAAGLPPPPPGGPPASLPPPPRGPPPPPGQNNYYGHNQQRPPYNQGHYGAGGQPQYGQPPPPPPGQQQYGQPPPYGQQPPPQQQQQQQQQQQARPGEETSGWDYQSYYGAGGGGDAGGFNWWG